MKEGIPTVLTIAGTDPTGCAGLIADVKTISALGGYALSVPTAIIAQNSLKVGRTMPVPPDMVIAQLESVIQAMPVMAIKIGLLPDTGIVRGVAEFLAAHGLSAPVVLDPVLCASTGQALVSEEVISAIRAELFPYLSLITPNLDEAAQLLACPRACTRDEMVQQATTLWQQGASGVLLKGGHLPDAEASPDLLVTMDGHHHWYEESRITTVHDRGTGCTLSSALAFYLRHHEEPEAVRLAKAYLRQVLQMADHLRLVEHRGPLNHFAYQS